MESTSGFYKKDQDQLLFAPNFVYGGFFELFKENKDSYQYPVSDWYWFDSEEEARTFFNLPKPVDPPLSQSMQNYLNNRDYNA